MSVIPLTVFFSLLLAGLFMVLFAHEQRRRRFASAERDSLLPLADERPVCRAGARDAAGNGLTLSAPGATGDAAGQPVPEDDIYF